MSSLNPRQKRNLRDILVSLVLFFGLIAIEKLVPQVGNNHLYMFLLFLVPYFIVGHNVVRKALLAIKNFQGFDESFLMTLATVGAFATGENAEAVAVMLFYQVGEWFQDYAVDKSRRSITALMDIMPDEAHVEVNGEIETMDPDDVEVGSIVVVKAGEKIPLDGKVVEGHSMVNTAAITGESVPRSVTLGDEIYSGSINGEGLLKIQTTKAYEDSTVSMILEMVENAAEKKSKTENFITKFARIYTPAVVIGAIVLAIVPSLITGEWLKWLYRACTFLVISCPCAIVVSVPLSFFGGIGAASKQGILVKGSNYLEAINDVKTVVTDKTGTLTKGTFSVVDIIPNSILTKKQVLREAALIESLSTHPIASSIKEAAVIYGLNINPNQVTDIQNITGMGMSGKVNGKTIYVGNAKLMKEQDIPYIENTNESSTVVYVGADHDFLGTILIADEIKDNAVSALRHLKNSGIEKIVMLTGDKKSVAESVAKKLGVDEVRAELLPGDKVNAVEEILKTSSNKNRVAYVGDGINDAPVLTRCDVGIAMGSMGSDAAIEAADIVLMDDNIDKLATTKRIAHKTVSIAKVNIIFAIAVKILTLIFGAVGIANMWWAVFADVGVAFICVLNSMRTLKAK